MGGRSVDAPSRAARGFDDPEFIELCALVRDYRGLPRDRVLARARTLWRLLTSVRLFRSVARLPREVLRTSDSPAGRRIRTYLPRSVGRRGHHLMAISTLTLPPTFEAYVTGRSRQALRTNSARAVDAGVTVTKVDEPGCVRERMLELFARRDEPQGAAWGVRQAELGEGEFWLALDADQRAVALAEVIVDEEVAMLTSMISAGPLGVSEARYLLAAEMVRSLSRRGIRHIVVSRAFSLPPGIIYFQKLLGFSPKNVRVVALDKSA